MHIGKNVVAELKRIEVERICTDNALLLQPLDARGDSRRGQPHLACKGLDRSAGVFLQQAQQFQVDFIHRAVALLIFENVAKQKGVHLARAK